MTAGPIGVERRLLVELARVAELIDPEPPYLRELGRSALGVRRVNEELAGLVADSAQLSGLVRGMPTELAAPTAAPSPRMLAFERDDVAVELEVLAAGAGFRLVGLVDGLADLVAVDVETAAGQTLPAGVDEWGRFVVAAVPAGPIRLRVIGADGELTTEWVRLG